MSNYWVYALSFGVALLCFQALKRLLSKSGETGNLPMPPGPARKFLIGNLLDIPTQWPWLKFQKWKDDYGDLVYLEAVGNRVLVLNTAEAVNDLLEKRPTIYSDRPTFVMAGEMFGLDSSMPMLPHGPVWRKHRKLTANALSPQAVKKYANLQKEIVTIYLNNLLEKPTEYREMLRLAVGRIVMSVTYGLPVLSADDPYITKAEHTMDMISIATVPGRFLVDFVPILKYYPSWFPFASFQKFAAEGQRSLQDMITPPFLRVKEEVEEGIARPSLTSDCLQSYQPESDETQKDADDLIRWAAGAMYGAGGETTYSTVLTFILAMALNPDIQTKAQAEIDSIVGTGRLPGLEDRPLLPYFGACIKETMRWHPALPLSIARKTNQADTYKGYHIPSGTIVMPNVWNISKDERSGISPSEFNPDRFLADRVKVTAIDPATYAFGFGRRVCPGRYLGDNSVFLFLSGILSAFDIRKEVDASGRELPLNPSFTGTLVSWPEPYGVSIKPRSPAAANLLKESMDLFSHTEAGSM